MSESEAKSELTWDDLGEEYISIAEGLKKKIIKEGQGDLPPHGSSVSVHYVGTLLSNGSEFDSSRGRNSPFSFNIGTGSVIRGWDEGVATMKVGEIAELVCAPDYGYGESGSPPKIPPNSTLKFEVEVLDFTESIDTPEQSIKVASEKKEEGNKLFNEGDFAAAKLTYKKAKELVQNLWDASGDHDAKAKELTIALGANITMCCLKLGEYFEAIEEGQEVLKKDPKNLKTVWRLGQAYLHVGEYEAGVEILQDGLKTAPDDPNLKNVLAQIHKKQAEYEKKEKDLYGRMFGGI